MKLSAVFPVLLIVLAFCPATLYPRTAPAARLVFLTEDYPPANYLVNGELKGYSVEILKAVWKELDQPPSPITVYPWARAYYLAQHEPNTVLFTMSRTPVREKLFKWVGPISVSRYVLVGLKKHPLAISRLSDAASYRIGVLRDDVGEHSLKNAGFTQKNLEPVTLMDQNFMKLLDNRIDLICLNANSLQEYSEKLKLDPDTFQVYLTVFESHHYYAFSRSTPDSVVRKYQAALKAIEQERLRILKTYGLK